MSDIEKKNPAIQDSEEEVVVAVENGVVVNASGYRDELKRQYGFWALAGMALTVDNAWVALGSSISISILNGGPPGLIFGLIVAVFYYIFIGLSLSELASSVPTAGGVYHWGTIAGGPRFGRFTGLAAGYINFYGWMFDLAALTQITANVAVSMYSVYHPEHEIQSWNVYIASLLVLWLCASVAIFFNRAAPFLQHVGTFFVVVGGIVTIIVLLAMNKNKASNHFVWNSFDENNFTGWPAGVAFLTGVLNGAFTIGTPDSVTHMAEELPHPRRDLPKAIMIQISLGFLYAWAFAVTISYSITDLDALLNGVNSYPLAIIYEQATAGENGEPNRGATVGLLFIVLCSGLMCVFGTLLTNSRTYWALARDNAVPVAGLFGKVNERLSCPVYATLFVCFVATGLLAIPLGSEAGFLALTGSFIVLTSVSYAIPFVANLLSGRKYFPRGPFHLGKAGWVVNILAVTFIVVFDTFFCFPFVYPATIELMNWNSVILVGTVFITGVWWLVHARKHYPGPKVMSLYTHTDVPVLPADKKAT